MIKPTQTPPLPQLDVCICTFGNRSPIGLEFIRTGYRIITSRDRPWPVAANATLDRTENDVLFLDDDIELFPESLENLSRYREKAEIIGFSLYRPDKNGWRPQSAGYMYFKDGSHKPCRDTAHAHYVAHVTASCMYISRRVIESGLRFPVWDGMYFEDIAFTLEAWLRGFRVAHIPGYIRHHTKQSPLGQSGSEKSNAPDLRERWRRNRRHLRRWEKRHNIIDNLARSVIPNGCIEIS